MPGTADGIAKARAAASARAAARRAAKAAGRAAIDAANASMSTLAPPGPASPVTPAQPAADAVPVVASGGEVVPASEQASGDTGRAVAVRIAEAAAPSMVLELVRMSQNRGVSPAARVAAASRVLEVAGLPAQQSKQQPTGTNPADMSPDDLRRFVAAGMQALRLRTAAAGAADVTPVLDEQPGPALPRV